MTMTEATDVDPMFLKGLFRNTKKMPPLFEIDREHHEGTDIIDARSAWIFNEPSRATFKRDGTGVLVSEDGTHFIRRAVKSGRATPAGFRMAEYDAVTGIKFGVEPVENSGFYKMFKEAVRNLTEPLTPGTFELVGTKINGNPDGFDGHFLIRHGSETLDEVPDMRDVKPEEAYAILRELFKGFDARGIEGVVWWGMGDDDRRSKLRVKDFFGDANRRR